MLIEPLELKRGILQKRRDDYINMRSMTFDDSHFALAGNNNNNTKTSSIYSGSFSSEGSPPAPHRFHISIDHVDDEDHFCDQNKLSTSHKTTDSGSDCFDCNQCNNNSLNMSHLSGLNDHQQLLKPNGFVLHSIFTCFYLYFELNQI